MPRICAFGCEPNDLSMHSFPNRVKFPERFKTWVALVGGQLKTETDYIYNSKRKVCDRHFTNKDRNRYNRLNALAVPSLHLLDSSSRQANTSTQQEIESTQCISVETEPPLLANVPIEKLLQRSTSPRQASTSTQQEIESTQCISVETEPPLLANVPIEKLLQRSTSPRQASTSTQQENGNSLPLHANRPVHKCSQRNRPSKVCKNAASLSVIMEHNYSAASRYQRKSSKKGGATAKTDQSKIKYLRSEICRLRKRAKTYKERLSHAEKVSDDVAFKEVVKNMTKRAQLFVHMQLQSLKKPKGRRFSVDEKVLALSLYKKSPKGYGLLYKCFTLPSKKAIKRLLSQIQLSSGINTIIFKKIRQTILKKKKEDRLCSLMFDEMSLKPQVTYNAKKDTLEGFANNDETKFADHALVFMVKGIKQAFKQPIAYYFTNGLKKFELKAILTKVIKMAQESGLIIINTVCDQSSVNVGAVNELIQNTKAEYLRQGKEWRREIFTINGQDIIPIFDAPHLIKGIRNNLITKPMVYTSNQTEKRVKWEHYEMIYAADKTYKQLRLLDKIMDEHIIPEKMNKMRVKLATQLFSHSFAVAAEHLTARGDLPEECRNIIDITLLLDNVFDSLNISSFNIPNGKKYKAAIKNNSPHFRLWKRAKKILKTVKFLKTSKVSNKIRITETTIPSIVNLVKTIEGVEAIWLVVTKKYGLDALLTRNFNQDPLENFFGNIRSYGVRNVAPNTVGFEGAFKALLLNNFNTPHSHRANCEEDNNECLEDLKFFLTEENIKSPDAPKEIPHRNEIVIENFESEDAGQSNYVCGWVLTKLLKNVKNCKICKKALIDENNENANNSFIKAKEYENKKWLTYPNKELENCFHQLQNITTGVLKKNVPKKNIKSSVIILADVLIDLPFHCPQHKDELKRQFLATTINVLVYSWCRCINRILDGKLKYDENEGDECKEAAQKYFNKHKNNNNKK